MIIKNYKELCSILEIKPATNSDYKQKQLKELAIYCKYTKQGNKYIIEDIYNKPVITLSDILKTKNNKYIKLLSNIILEYLYNNPDTSKQIPLINLFAILGITNNNYKHANNYRKELSQLYNVQLASIYYFYDNTKNEFKRIIERCLNNLQNRSVLVWNKCIIVINKDKTTYKADKQTTKLILDTQKEALKYLNVNTMYEVMKDKEKRKQFNKILKTELSFNYYYAYELIIGEKAIQIEYDTIQADKSKLNNLIIDKTNIMFDKNIFLPFKAEYDILINNLINISNDEDIKTLLEEQKEENKKNYIKELSDNLQEYNNKNNIIENKYMDIYK